MVTLYCPMVWMWLWMVVCLCVSQTKSCFAVITAGFAVVWECQLICKCKWSLLHSMLAGLFSPAQSDQPISWFGITAWYRIFSKSWLCLNFPPQGHWSFLNLLQSAPKKCIFPLKPNSVWMESSGRLVHSELCLSPLCCVRSMIEKQL